MSRTSVQSALTRLLRAAALWACPFAAQAGEVSLKLQPGLAVPLPASRSQRFDVGSAASLQALLGLARYVDVEFGVGFVGLPMSSAQLSSLPGVACTYGAGLRLKRPHDQRSFHGASPWVEAEALYVRAGRLGGAGFAAGAGLAFPLGLARKFWLGPFVRYLDVFQPNRLDLDNGASSTLFAGLTFEVVLKR
jgi:hypothetical protein